MAPVIELSSAIEQAKPHGIRHLAVRHPDQPQFELLLHQADGADNPLPQCESSALPRPNGGLGAYGPHAGNSDRTRPYRILD